MAKGGSARRHRRVKRRRGRAEQMKRMRSPQKYGPSLKVFKWTPAQIVEGIRRKAVNIRKANKKINPEWAFAIAADKLLGEGFWASWNAWKRARIQENKEPNMEEFIEQWVARFRKK
jgi:hypothetical protein